MCLKHQPRMRRASSGDPGLGLEPETEDSSGTCKFYRGTGDHMGRDWRCITGLRLHFHYWQLQTFTLRAWRPAANQHWQGPGRITGLSSSFHPPHLKGLLCFVLRACSFMKASRLIPSITAQCGDKWHLLQTIINCKAIPAPITLMKHTLKHTCRQG